jgi:hypothetical protein
MAIDITDRILSDHAKFRAAFIELETLTDKEELGRRWLQLATDLEVHATAEEQIFFPVLLRNVEDIESETKDAIKDHNKIRDASRATGSPDVGSDAWWSAVHEARKQTLDHLKEEENDDLPAFVKNVDDATRSDLGAAWDDYHAQHPDGKGLSGKDKDPQEYVERKTG